MSLLPMELRLVGQLFCFMFVSLSYCESCRKGLCLIHLCNPGVQHHTGHIQDARETIRTELTRKGP